MERSLFLALARQALSTVARFPRILGTKDNVSIADIPSTRVEDSGRPAAQAAVTMSAPDALLAVPVVSEGTQKAKRFRRTPEEIRLGLSIYDAQAARQAAATGHGVLAAVVDRKGVELKAKRFRRTQEELRLGLSIEEAAKRRGVTVPAKTQKFHVEKVQPAKRPASDDLMSTLPQHIQTRAAAVSRYRARGGKAVLTAETLDQIEGFVAAGKIKVCPPCTDSDGYDHLNQRGAK
jgi:hypothetical protein